MIEIYIYRRDVNVFQIYLEKKRQFSLVRNNPRDIVEKVATDIERLLAKKRKALEVRKHAHIHTRSSFRITLDDSHLCFPSETGEWSGASSERSSLAGWNQGQVVLTALIIFRLTCEHFAIILHFFQTLHTVLHFTFNIAFARVIQVDSDDDSYVVSTDSLKWIAQIERFILSPFSIFSICVPWCTSSSHIHIRVSLIQIRALPTLAVSHYFCESVAGGSV